MGMSVGDHGGLSAEPNVIPMIDILLVLLIIFMISQPLARMAIDVQVPPLETAAASNAPSTQIVLNILDDGNYEINGQPVPAGQLDTQIHAIYDNRPAKLIFIKAQSSRTYQDWIRASDIVRGAGVEVIGFTPKGT